MPSNSQTRSHLLNKIRKKLSNTQASLGTWQQIQSIEISKLLAIAGYDWITIDLEHGSFDNSFLSGAFDTILAHGALPFARISRPDKFEARLALDKGAAGIIIPMIETKEQVDEIIDYSIWPPKGSRGVGFCNANDFGKSFETYKKESQKPFISVMIENFRVIKQLDKICSSKSIDSIFIGPYDLSASLGVTGDFRSKIFNEAQKEIFYIAKKKKPFGFHVVEPSKKIIYEKIKLGASFIAIGTDSVFINNFANLDRFYERKRNKTS